VQHKGIETSEAQSSFVQTCTGAAQALLNRKVQVQHKNTKTGVAQKKLMYTDMHWCSTGSIVDRNVQVHTAKLGSI
jgi:hypothetical protein